MKIDAVIPCRYVEVNDNLATIVGAGTDTFWISEEPWFVEHLLPLHVAHGPPAG